MRRSSSLLRDPRPASLWIRRVLMVLLAAFVATLGSCGGGGDGGGPDIPGIEFTLPTRVSASWGGGAMGPPIDRLDVEATEWTGLMCPASHLGFDYNGVTLNFVNNCNIPVTYAICVADGSLQGANLCATDPYETSQSNLLFTTLNPGNLGDFRNASGNLHVNFFYCSDNDTLVGGPLRCIPGP